MSNAEILGDVAFVIASVTFFGMCFWTMHNLGKDSGRRKHKTKKA